MALSRTSLHWTFRVLVLKILLSIALSSPNFSWKTLVEDLDNSRYSNWYDSNGTQLTSYPCNVNIRILGGNWKTRYLYKEYTFDETFDEVLLQLTYYIETQAFLKIVINNVTFFNDLITSAGQTNSKDFINCQGTSLYFQDIVAESMLNETTSKMKVEMFLNFNSQNPLFLGFYKLKLKVPGLSQGLLAVIIIIPTIAFVGILGVVIWRIRVKKKRAAMAKGKKEDPKNPIDKIVKPDQIRLDDIALCRNEVTSPGPIEEKNTELMIKEIKSLN